MKEEKVIIIGVETPDDHIFAYTMDEMNGLCKACGLTPVAQVVQKQDRIHMSQYMGKGKLEEIVEMVEEQDIVAIVCNDELTPSQYRNIDEVIPCEVLDRTMIILNIFAKRAKTKEAMLQVEISSLQYQLPRLIGSYEVLGRQGGGGFYNRGGGETKLELDKRLIEARINKKKKELKKVVQERKTQRERRKHTGVRNVALVGYTNAGKSTLMNAFVSSEDKEVYVEDMVFATLETRVRNVKLDEQMECLLTDTVGFVDKLPHHLIQAFRSTLEEVKEADLLLHVIDSSNPYYKEQMDTTIKTLQDIGIEGIPMIEVYNKIDVKNELQVGSGEDKVYISASNQEGIDLLKVKIKDILFKDYITKTLKFPYQMGDVISKLNEEYPVYATENAEDGVILEIFAPQFIFDKYAQYII